MCPQCAEPMIIVECQGVEIDCCVRCRGSWLDAGELEWIAELAGITPATMAAALQVRRSTTAPQRACPRCRRRMQTIAVQGTPEVELERCPQGHGLWFDAGELPAVIHGLHGGAAAEVARLLETVHHHDLESTNKGD